MKIVALLGSTKKDSVNKQILRYIAEKLPSYYEVEYFDLSRLPFFNPDLDIESALPEAVQDLRKAIEESKGVLICSPEYVFSVTALLKNAIEWLVSTMVFTDKPTAVVTSASSGEKAHESLLLIMNTLGAVTVQGMELLIRNPKIKFDAEGLPTDVPTELAINQLVHDFESCMKSRELYQL